MKHLLLLLILICMYDTAKSQWVTCHTSTELNFTAIEMVDNNTAYATGSSSGSRVAKNSSIAVGGNTIMFTGNGGGSTSINIISSEVPSEYSLSQNYPNPFNPATRIKFGVPKSSFVKLAVYDMLGKEISSLVNEQLQPGTYEYEFEASGFNSGVYFYKLSTKHFSQVRKMILIR